MIKGKLRVELTIDTVLERTTPYEIYRYYFGDFTINEVTCNKLRGDRNPSFIIGNKYGDLSHFDYGDEYWRGDCFALVKQIYKLGSLDAILRLIDRDLKLGISDGSEVRTNPVSQQKPPEIEKKVTLIQVTTRRFTKQELEFWAKYYQNEEDLKINNIFSIKKLFLNKKLFFIPDEELRFGYYHEPGYWKCYFPNRIKRKKWLPNNIPLTTLDGKENVKNCDTLLINKSKKDMMLMKKIFPCSMSVQNESLACFSKENVDFIKNNSKRQILSFDSDEAGVRASLLVTKQFGFDYINVPKKYLDQGIKDWADLAKIHGMQAVEEVLKQKQLL